MPGFEVMQRERLMTGFVKTGWVTPLVELVESGQVIECDGGVVLDTVIQESIALEARFGVLASGRIDIEAREPNQRVCERRSNEYTGSTVCLITLVPS